MHLSAFAIFIFFLYMGASKDVIATNKSNKEINDTNNAFNAQQAELNRQFQKEQTDAQNQWNLDLWNLNNDYNTPANQLKRLQEAGINPNMYSTYSSGSSMTASSSSTPSGSSASAAGSIPMEADDTFANTLNLINSVVNGGTSIASSFFGNTANAAQTRLINANAKAQEIQNMRTESADAGLGNLGLYLSSSGDFINDSQYQSLPSSEKVNYQLVTSNNRQLSEKGKPVAGSNLGQFDAAHLISNLFRDVSANKSQILQNNLTAQIYGQQIKNPAVIASLADLPTKQFELLNSQVQNSWKALENAGVTTKLLEDEHQLNESQIKVLEEQLDTMKNSSLSKWFNSVTQKEDVSAKDLLRGLIIGFSQFSSGAHIKIGK